jgi:predicted secreted hydrolase
MRRAVGGLATIVALMFAAWAVVRLEPTAPPSVPPELRLDDHGETPGFARVLSGRRFELPRDHGPHFRYQTEWWYYTGNLRTAEGRRFGYQLTFFRRGLSPGPPPEGSGIATNQIYFAHLGLTDVSAETHTGAERFSRGALGLAGAQAEPYSVWLESWSAHATNADGSRVELRAEHDETSLRLELSSLKPLVAHGYYGMSPKSRDPGNASYYLSYTRMKTEGSLVTASGTFAVTGESWFDHEWGTSALGEGAVGWDWFSLQMSDARELMLFQVRRSDGGVEPVSGGTLVEPDGRPRQLRVSDVDVGILDRWQSPESGAVYPSRWILALPAEQLELDVRPWLASQEMRTSFTYWEGAVRLRGSRAGVAITGDGYVEMTGYARSMQGVF